MGCTASTHHEKPATAASADACDKAAGVRVLVLFYSTYGHIYKMAEAVAKGAREVPGARVSVKRVPETLSAEVLAKMGAVEAQQQFSSIPVLSDVYELAEYDCIIVGCPTRYGMMAAQMQQFVDASGGLWTAGSLVGKVGSAFTSSATQHGGQEATIRHAHTWMLHHGMLLVGLPYSFQGQMGVEELMGGSPYGATTIAAGDGSRQPSTVELEGAAFQGRHATEIAAKLVGKKCEKK